MLGARESDIASLGCLVSGRPFLLEPAIFDHLLTCAFLFCSPERMQYDLVALDTFTGKRVWASNRQNLLRTLHLSTESQTAP